MTLDWAPDYCDNCGNTGTVPCYCGGDTCVCGEEETECTHCDGGMWLGYADEGCEPDIRIEAEAAMATRL